MVFHRRQTTHGAWSSSSWRSRLRQLRLRPVGLKTAGILIALVIISTLLLSSSAASVPQAGHRGTSALSVASTMAAPGAVSGYVKLQGRSDHSGALVSMAGLRVHTVPDGYFSLDGIAPGVYELTVKAPGFLSQRVSGVSIVSGQTTELTQILMPAGDLTGDGFININDLALMGMNFGKVSPVPPRQGVSVHVAESDNTHLKATVRFPQPRLWQVQVNSDTYTQVAVAGTEVAGSALGPPGHPAMPLYRRLVAVPQGAEVVVRFMEPHVGDTMQGVNLYPVQPETPDAEGRAGEVGDFGNRPFTRDDAAYQVNSFIPQEPVRVQRIGRMRDMELAEVTIAAGQYNPLGQELRFFETVSFELGFYGGSGDFVTIRGSETELTYNQYGAVLNHDAVSRFVNVYPGTFINVGYEYLIITDPAFRAAADALATWKRTRGISTSVVQTDAIVAGGDSIATQRQKIQAFIRGEYETNLVQLAYVLLLGDAEHIPPWYRTVWDDTDSEQSAGTDLDYALMNDGDILPDLALGRIPVDTLEQAQAVVNKIISYEQSPPTAAEFYQRLSFASYFEMGRNDVVYQGTDARAFVETAELVRDYLVTRGYDVERIYTTDTDYHDDPTQDDYYTGFTAPTRYYDTRLLPDDLRGPVTGFAWDGDTQDIVDAYNQGRFLVLHRDHGGKNGWSKPSFATTDLSQLSNGNLLPVVFSVNCASGLFDNETNGGAYSTSTSGVYWAEQILRMSGGAVGVLGDTRNSPTWANNAITRGFFDAIWPDLLADYGGSQPITRLGDILNYGKLYMASQVGVAQTAGDVTSARSNDNIVLYHAFGDPTLELWTENPYPRVLPSDYTVLALDPSHMQVGYSVEGATITAFQQGLLLGQAQVKNGIADMSFYAEVDPTIDIDLSINRSGAISVATAPITEIVNWGRDIRVTDIEVSQGIQNLANEMPLVEDRRTIVRVYVDNASFSLAMDTDISGVRARLHASSGGSTLSSSPLYAMNNPITVKADGGDRRNLDDSFWFYLPSHWRTGTVTFRAEVNYDDSLDEFDKSDNEQSVTVTFREAEPMNVVLVPLHLHINGDPDQGTAIFWGDERESYRWDLYNFMYRLHPIAELNMWRFTDSLKPEDHPDDEWDMSDDDDASEALARIWWLDSETTNWASELHYMGGVEAVMPAAGYGLGYTSGSDRQSWVRMTNTTDGWPDWYIRGGNSMAHELAHNEARLHVSSNGSEANPDPNYPWPYPDAHLAEVDDEGYFGLDVYYSKWGLSEPAVIDNDDDAYPLMGYARPRWIDPYTYAALLNRYGVSNSLSWPSGVSPQAAVPAHVAAVLQAEQLVTAMGIIDPGQGTGRFLKVALQPAGDVFSDTVADWQARQQSRNDTSPYTLAVLDATGQVLHSQPVAVLDPIEVGGEPLTLLELVPWPQGAASLVLRQGEVELARKSTSPNVPTVRLLSPAQTTSGAVEDPLNLRWEATDADNDRLTFSVLYSPDGGERWWPVALDVRGDGYSIPLANLPGSLQGLFRVKVSDGFNVGRDDADVAVVIPGSPPIVTILSPRDSAKLDSRRVLVLEGAAEDMEDILRGDALVWISNVDGILGTGEEVVLGPGILRPGVHEITLTATDSDGMKGMATVRVTVLSPQ